MPTLPPRLCAAGCGARVSQGRCAACAQAKGLRRLTSTARGYGSAWRRFRRAFVSSLIAGGTLPACGARHPDAPPTQDSRCLGQGYIQGSSADGSDLHLDHDPPLEDWERDRPDRVCDPLRVQLLCAECHARKDDPGRTGRRRPETNP